MHVTRPKKLSALILAAFVGVFVFGCVMSGLDTAMAQTSDTQNMHMASSQQKHPAPEEEHMSVTLALPADAQTGVSAVAFLALIACAFSYILQTTLLRPETARFRLRSRKEIFSEHIDTKRLFRTGLLNPKIY